MWKTKITEMLGIEYPIIQGAFGSFGTSALAAPVSEAGGLGMITATALKTPEGLREDIRRAKSMTTKPFGVNLTMAGSPHIEEMREVVIEEGVPVVETAAYRAEAHGKRLQERGVKWLHKVATVKHALAAEQQGADAVIVVGLEGAGFKSPHQLPTLISVTWAVRQLRVPVIAAGGIADGRGLMAALAMGAEAVYMGTAFMATKECPISERHKLWMTKADPSEPKYRDRCLAPPKPEEIEKVMEMRGSVREDEWLNRLEQTMLKGSSANSIPNEADMEEEILRNLPGSLAVAVIEDVISVRELIETIMSEAEAIRRRWALFQDPQANLER